MEKIINFKEKMITLQNISLAERFDFFARLEQINAESISEIEKARKLYNENLALIQKLSRNQLIAEELMREDATLIDMLIDDFHLSLTSQYEKKK